MAAGEMSPLQAFGQGLLRLVTPEGRVLDPTQVLTEAGWSPGEVAWKTQQKKIRFLGYGLWKGIPNPKTAKNFRYRKPSKLGIPKSFGEDTAIFLPPLGWWFFWFSRGWRRWRALFFLVQNWFASNMTGCLGTICTSNTSKSFSHQKLFRPTSFWISSLCHERIPICRKSLKTWGAFIKGSNFV